jgi:thiol-disulfide isomerase/thioredoxin
LRQYRVLIAGILSPPAALFLYWIVYTTLTQASTDRTKDWVFRLLLSTLAMGVPFVVTLVLAIGERRRRALTLSAKVGLALALLSLTFAWKPVRRGIQRAKQSRNLALRDVTAPPFSTRDIFGESHRLGDHMGKVVIVNVWATWCGPCRKEMPELDRLYRERKDEGFIVFGLSTEDVEVQRKFVEEKVGVSYPLLTVHGEVPELYRDVVRLPAIFLIDRRGRLQPAPGPGAPFNEVEAAVDALLEGDPSTG